MHRSTVYGPMRNGSSLDPFGLCSADMEAVNGRQSSGAVAAPQASEPEPNQGSEAMTNGAVRARLCPRSARGTVADMSSSPRVFMLGVAVISMACGGPKPAGPGADQKAAEAEAADKDKAAADKAAVAAPKVKSQGDPGSCKCETGHVWGNYCNTDFTPSAPEALRALAGHGAIL